MNKVQIAIIYNPLLMINYKKILQLIVQMISSPSTIIIVIIIIIIPILYQKMKMINHKIY
jgi:hypothetical protein